MVFGRRGSAVVADRAGVLLVGGRRGVAVLVALVLLASVLVVLPGVSAVAAPGNVARAAGVSVSASSQNTSTGQSAVKAVDGVASGYPGDATREWATVGGKAGSWIQLVWSSPVTIDRVVLYDRPNVDDRVTGGSLVFSSGAAVAVTSLVNAGGATEFTFSSRTVTSVRLNITSVSTATHNVGLAEFEVWGEAGTPSNRAPVASAGPDQSVVKGALVTLDGSGSSDPDGTAVSYAWVQTSGPGVVLSGTSVARPTFTPTGAGVHTFRLTVSDGVLSATDEVSVSVSEPSSSMNLARVSGVTVSASSQNTSTGQTALKAVDGVPSGYPADSSREWATVGGKAGSWIRLVWSSPVSVDRVVLYDRPNTEDRVNAGALVFSDGSSVPVGALNNAGGATTVSFPARTVSEVRFNISSVSTSTHNVGLAEFEVWGAKVEQAPVARAGADQSVGAGAVVTLDGSASSDPEGAVLTYQWAQTSGTAVTLTGPTTAKPTFTAPATGGTLTFSLTVSDGGKTHSDTVAIVVIPPGTLSVTNSGTSAVWAANFSSSLSGTTITLQKQTIVTKVTGEVTQATWVTIASGAANSSGDRSFTITDPLEVSHSYRAVAGAVPTNVVAYQAPLQTTSTGLPTIHVNTNEGHAVDSKDVWFEAQFSMTGGPGCTAVTSSLTRVRGRGNTTWEREKKPYNINLDKKIDLCGMGGSKKWALLANDFDPALMRTEASMYFGSKLTGMPWTPKTRPVDVFINGEFLGSYTLIERVTTATNRVDIDELKDNQNGVNDGFPAVTGGYILEWDHRARGDHNVFVGDGSGWVAIKEPEDEDDGSGITPAQIAYVDQYLDEVDAAMFSDDFEDDAVGWKKYIDVASAVDYYIVMELTKIDDGNMWASTNMYKERDADPAPGDQGKLFFGPMWDYDTSMGYSLEWEGEYQPGDLISPTGWYLRDNLETKTQSETVSWFYRLNEDPEFRALVAERWSQVVDELRTSDEYLSGYEDLIAASATQNFVTWWGHTPQVARAEWQEQVDYMRNWLDTRIEWMDDELN